MLVKFQRNGHVCPGFLFIRIPCIVFQFTFWQNLLMLVKISIEMKWYTLNKLTMNQSSDWLAILISPSTLLKLQTRKLTGLCQVNKNIPCKFSTWILSISCQPLTWSSVVMSGNYRYLYMNACTIIALLGNNYSLEYPLFESRSPRIHQHYYQTLKLKS